ncbi:WLM-domain-containing protein [Dendrothele bispora CBS 962.96]|uniref:WLM-domain-containing protein n=1 Tax=Dendrothele bispora (strain CBS 962.96) TaxID=1314807 RepID=A0A4S8MTQ6_DENBC|nr:WLM-domain-containing protein [Dendrothele bispora CBS 962.96]
MPEVFVQSFTHLKDRKNADHALTMLKRIASLVKPIMRKHGWVLPTLAEFFPDNPSLLGEDVNMGEKILLRLRPAHYPDWFMEEADVVQTMLHELTHNVHGPHDDKFYKFLSGLQEEYDALQRSGYAGEGFFSKGQRLGQSVSHNLPPHLARTKALEAAEKRRKTSQTLGGDGRRLGGVAIGSSKPLSPRELAARAAERRALDEKMCGQGEMARKEAEKAAKESVENKVIDLTLDDSDDEIEFVDVESNAGPSHPPIPSKLTDAGKMNVNKARSTPTASLQTTTTVNTPAVNLATKPTVVPATVHPDLSEWSCPACTLLNPAMVLQCEACLTTKPSTASAGWTCLTCGESGMPHDFWTCSFCGSVKISS